MIDHKTREFAVSIPVEPEESSYIPPDIRRDLIDPALDVLAGPESRAKTGAPAILAILTHRPRSTDL